MKHTRHQGTPRIAGLKLTPVRFEFAHPTAKTVCLAGSFNHWHPEARTLHSTGAGNWWQETSLAPGTYEYCFVVDGQWMPDPRSNETVANPFGGRNSVLHVAISPEAAHLADAETLPMKKETNQTATRL
ncbi:MAG: glycogen-binding domain-containing protein [Verrucomicrobiota bacterium]|jgi:1,4-alpha-glucan branching enzyme